MRFIPIFAFSITAVLLPAVAISDPVQSPASTNAQPGPAVTATEAPAAAQAQTTTQSPAAPSQSATGATTQKTPETVVVRGDRVDLDHVICKAAPAETGSRIGGGQECHTEREWNRRMRESQDITRRQQLMGFHP